MYIFDSNVKKQFEDDIDIVWTWKVQFFIIGLRYIPWP